MFTQSMLVKDIVTAFPEAADLFKQHRIDFCCGGARPLADAAAERGVDTAALLQNLEEVYEQAKARCEMQLGWNEATPSELIRHIQTKHHQYLIEELPQLSPYVTKVMRVHGANQPHLVDIYRLFNELKTELEQHTFKEESEVFPLILQLEQADERTEQIKANIRELEQEHDHAGTILKELRSITNDFTPPEHACGTYRLVYQRLEALESDLFQHIHLENNILFPKVLQ